MLAEFMQLGVAPRTPASRVGAARPKRIAACRAPPTLRTSGELADRGALGVSEPTTRSLRDKDLHLTHHDSVRTELPSGTVTFLFTDVEGSTKLLHELGAEEY